MKQIIYTLLIIMCLTACAENSFGQQDPLFTQYFFNPLTVNSGYAGTRDGISTTLLVREQWVGLEGRPRTQSLSIHSPLLNDAIALGGTVIKDEVGPTTSTSLFGDLAYRMKLNENSKIAFGLKAGLNLLSANLQNLSGTDNTDLAFGQNIKNAPLPNFGASVYWWAERHFLGLSAPKIIENKLPSSQIESVRGEEKRHLFLMGGYVFDLTPSLKVKPMFMAKMVSNAPVSLDLTTTFLLDDKLWIGGMWRLGDAVGGILSYQITNQFRAGYSYDYSISSLRGYNKGSHEFMIGYDFNLEKDKFLSPRFF